MIIIIKKHFIAPFPLTQRHRLGPRNCACGKNLSIYFKNEIDTITKAYGGVPAVPWSFLVGIDGEIIATYPGAILKQYDPLTYYRLEQSIVSEIDKINQLSK